MTLFSPSTIRNPWLEALTVFAAACVWGLALAGAVFMLEWASSMLPAEPWSWGPIVG